MSVESPQSRLTVALALTGFVAVAVAQVTNMILARANAGAIPPFSLAFFRWLIVTAGLAPFVWAELKANADVLLSRGFVVVLAGFFGMFLCGGPIYIAGVSTTAINIALIYALSPIVVLVISWLTGMELIGRYQIVGIVLALAGALTIILRGSAASLMSADTIWGDLLVVVAMLAWSGYTLLQSRAASEVSFLGRVCVFAAVGSLFSLPFAAYEAIAAPHTVFSVHALGVYLFAGLVPGVLAYAGFAYLGGRFGSVRTSLVLYIGPVASALLSWVWLHEGPSAIQIVGGALILGGVWFSLRK
ncbi:DMT family transporter [Rhodoplanes sp. Z2-YC6860]|uniref:DMT family transporter n=1 Tax=Rhodoplanes sp. Z2-YC6860 TaxID=674703 RepID=UPI00078CF782|nr:DMT family transporter [Rhodoplanes sp. Z2-YC6860]AMN39891.1 DMT superfamily drug/metabolite transporter [Rhodoplanes sp. Z2-YC6860]